ncbi:carbon-nitrogen hydrolase [Penicillium nucicola]|uniref:carbon-nitrogen hydrolase n=1 Tax=Penicillium nucicola TaxID=1850975 RepID=UPI002545B6D6|nr:carbon-nitrogen hydrolase [Penicillium nucicola]KAJ5758169.1 carbon-nitrogen hydrolase [Penicillium nucicola]
MSQTPVDLDPSSPIKVAVVQAEPSWFDVQAAVTKTCNLITEAGRNGAKLIAFPELWIPGYPTFLFAHTTKVVNDYMLEFYKNSISADSIHMATIRKTARAADIMVVLGISERHGGSLYMSQTFIGSDGSVLLHRRKLKPTGPERIIFGEASGDCAKNVIQTPIGRVGGLQCFEHLQSLLKYNTFFQGEQIHVASWPCLFPPIGKMPFFNTVEACRMATHTLAVEGGVFVLLASSIQTEKGLKANGLVSEDDAAVVNDKGEKETPHTAVTGGGFSVVIAPDGRALTKPVPADWEGLIYCDLDFDEIYRAKQWVDPVGHYSRPDIFTLMVRNETRRHVELDSVGDGFEHVQRFPELEEE